MKTLLIFSTMLLAGCYPFYEADATNWAVGVRGTHQEVADAIRRVIDPDAQTLGGGFAK